MNLREVHFCFRRDYHFSDCCYGHRELDEQIVHHELVLAWARELTPAPKVALLAGAEHFFHGRLADLRAEVQSFLR